jgi:tRNA dimethylallyltransferase
MKQAICIVGQTATGKTKLALALAKQLNGIVISADSRQIYKGMDIGTGKDVPKGEEIFGIDLTTPDKPWDVTMVVALLKQKIGDVWREGKLPILVGGTGFYFRSLIETPATFRIPMDEKLREELEKKSVDDLQKMLLELDELRFNRMNHSDQNNPRRLIRAIEVAQTPHSNQQEKIPAPLDGAEIAWIGLRLSEEALSRNVRDRVQIRIEQGMQNEVQKLMEKYKDWSSPAFSATGYGETKAYIEKKISNHQWIQLWQLHEEQYAKRQMTWFHKQPGITWFEADTPDLLHQVVKTIKT